MPIIRLGKGTVLNTSVFEFPTGRTIVHESQDFQDAWTDDLPGVPALPDTLLALEVLLLEHVVDLHTISQVILGDLGATLQVLRLAGCEYGNAPDRPLRIQDCISDLGLQRCFEAIGRGGPVSRHYRRSLSEIWRHSREIAGRTCMIAAEADCGIRPDEAWIAGLLHSIGILPDLLDWKGIQSNLDQTAVALTLADRWCLPSVVKDALCGFYVPGYDARWSHILHSAHLVNGQTSGLCALTQETGGAASAPTGGLGADGHLRTAAR